MKDGLFKSIMSLDAGDKYEAGTRGVWQQRKLKKDLLNKFRSFG